MCSGIHIGKSQVIYQFARRNPTRCAMSDSDAASTPTPPKNEAKPKNRFKIAVIAVAVIAVVIGALFIGFLSSRPQGQPVWLFKGAYATYKGTTSIMFVNFSFTLRQEVVDFNATHAEILTRVSMESSLSEPVENESTVWVDLSKNMYVIENATLVSSYEGNVYFEGLGNRNCVIYEYETDGPTITIYVDKVIGWPLKMKISMTGEDSLSLNLDINMVETNIPGLK